MRAFECKGRVSCVGLSSCGRLAAFGGSDKTVQIRALEEGCQLCYFDSPGEEVKSVHMSSGGQLGMVGRRGWSGAGLDDYLSGCVCCVLPKQL